MVSDQSPWHLCRTSQLPNTEGGERMPEQKPVELSSMPYFMSANLHNAEAAGEAPAPFAE